MVHTTKIGHDFKKQITNSKICMPLIKAIYQTNKKKEQKVILRLFLTMKMDFENSDVKNLKDQVLFQFTKCSTK